MFICGPSPHWLLVTGRGALRLHPMGIDGPIDSFAPFHNINCPRGFLYFNRQVGRPHRPGQACQPPPRTTRQDEVLGPKNEALNPWLGMGAPWRGESGCPVGGGSQGQGGDVGLNAGEAWRTRRLAMEGVAHKGTSRVQSLVCPLGTQLCSRRWVTGWDAHVPSFLVSQR